MVLSFPKVDMKRRAIRARATELALAFLVALREQEGIMDVFGSAGDRFSEVAINEEEYNEAYNKYMAGSQQ